MSCLARRSSHVAKPAADVLAGKQKEEDDKMAEMVVDDRDDEIAKLRKWRELASVFNFLTVFEPVIGKIGKASAEEIEMGLVTPNDSLAQIHIALLKDPENKKIIVCDEKLKKIFAGKDRVGFLEIAGLITPHFL